MYVSGRVVSNQVGVDGKTEIVLAIVGDAGEPDIQFKYHVPSNPSMPAFRNALHERITELNLARTVSTLPSVQENQIILPLARTASAATPKQIWNAKLGLLDRYLELQSKGVTAINAATTALLADINATYQAGHAD